MSMPTVEPTQPRRRYVTLPGPSATEVHVDPEAVDGWIEDGWGFSALCMRGGGTLRVEVPHGEVEERLWPTQ